MENKYLKRIYEFLEFDLLEKLEYPCDNCRYFECEKNNLNSEDIIRKKYKWNDIDWRQCLKREKKKLIDLLDLLKLKEFKKWSYEKCTICKNKFFKQDMTIHSEVAIEPTDHKKRVGYELRLITLCKRCNRSYVHRKNPLNKGFRKL